MKMFLTACVLVLMCFAATAGGLAPKQSPDDWSNLEYHAGGNFVIGILVSTAKPEWSALKQWGVCQIPGALHELVPSRGNYRSNRDLIANAAGCGLGVWAGHGFGAVPIQGGTMIIYTTEFK
jgi:hypothetical protein